jgi:type IV secretory pathway VirB2 component (pilin)
MKTLLRRLGGIGLVVLSLGPIIAVVAGMVVVIALCVSTVRTAAEKVAGIAAIVGNEIVPQVRKVQASYAEVAAEVAQMKTEVGNAVTAVTQIQDISIEQGQFGSTGTLQIHIPERDVSVGPVKLNDGQLFNQSLPAIQIPPAPVTLPMAPVRAAFAPIGPNGPVAQAIGASERELESSLGEVTKLQQPLEEIGTTVTGALAPLEAVVMRIAIIGAATLGALVLLLAIYVVAGVLFVIYRPGEAGRAFRTGGALGFAGFIHRTLLSDGLSRLFGRMPPPSPEQATTELQQMIARLETELAALQASLTASRALPAHP